MIDLELAQRLGIAIAIGALVGAERHWRERGDSDGQRTAGLRTFTLIGMLGGIAGALELALRHAGSSFPDGLVLGSFFVAFSAAFGTFHYREQQADNTYSVTSVIAAMLTFGLGALAVLGDMRLAGGAGVVLVAILAAREALHRFIEAVTFAELRSAIVLLAMTFVILPLVPQDAVGPFGGISPARIWTLAILLAAISFVGYVAVKLMGESQGELVAGAVAGLLSSTAATIANARRSDDGGDSYRLAAGALAAGSVSYIRTALLIVALAPSVVSTAVPALAAGSVVAAGAALMLARRDTDRHAVPDTANPFDLGKVFQMAVLLTVIGFATRAASAWFGDTGVVAVSAISGLADVDAPVIAAAGMVGAGTSLSTVAVAMLGAVATNTVAKAVYGLALGSRSFALAFAAGSVAALIAGAVSFTAFWSLT